MKILLLFFMFFLSLISKNTAFANDKVIESTCKRTPYYKLCVSTFKADTRSVNADVLKLAHISVDIISGKANYAQSHIKKLLKSTKDSETKQGLINCRDNYNGVIKGDIPQAVAALTGGVYKFAEQATADAALEAQYCERGFSKSPISEINNDVHHISVVAQSIVRILLTS